MNIPTLAAAFIAAVHPSPLVAEYYVLGDAEVVRLAGEATYTLDHPQLASTVHFGSKDSALTAGAAEVSLELITGFRTAHEPAYEDGRF